MLLVVDVAGMVGNGVDVVVGTIGDHSADRVPAGSVDFVTCARLGDKFVDAIDLFAVSEDVFADTNCGTGSVVLKLVTLQSVMEALPLLMA